MKKKLTFVVLVAVLTVLLMAATAAAAPRITPPGIAISQAVAGDVRPLAPAGTGSDFTTFGYTAGPAGLWDWRQ